MKRNQNPVNSNTIKSIPVKVELSIYGRRVDIVWKQPKVRLSFLDIFEA